MDILGACDDEALVHAFGASTLGRAADYVASGQVVSVERSARQDRIMLLEGRVAGTAVSPYAVTVTLAMAPNGIWIDARCSCPVVRMCKHAAAVVLAERGQGEESSPRAWEHRLGLVLEELEEAAAVRARPRPQLGLLVEVPPRKPGRVRAWESAGSSRPAVRVRPVRSGARGWVRSGASWADLTVMERRGEHDPAQIAVLTELLSAHRAANRQAYFGADDHLSLQTFGPSLWPLLEAAEQAGVELVPGGRLSGVQVRRDPVRVTLDVNGGAGNAAHVRLGVLLGEPGHEGATADAGSPRWYAGSELDLVGAAGHGVLLWDRDDADGWSVTLAPLAVPVGPHTRRLLTAAESLSVPSEELPDLVEGVLPQVQRHLPVTSTDSSVRVPESAPPRLALTVTWKAVDEVHLAWSWRYRIGSDDRVYGLDEQRGLRGLRRPAEERALLVGLDLSGEQVHRLFGNRRRDEGPKAQQTLTAERVLAFVEETLVPLERSGQVEIDEIGARPDFREATESPVIRFAPRVPDGEEAGSDDIGVHERTDWLDLEVVVTIGELSVGLATLVEALTLGQERLILRDGRHIRLDRPEFAQLTELIREARELADQPSDGVVLHRQDLGLWEELAEIGVVDAQASRWVESARALRELVTLPAAEPVGVEATLRSYQIEGFRWLAFLHDAGLGGILADDMGLGKTLQTLALVARARADGAGPFLVVAPTSVVAGWESEAAHFTPGLTVRTVTESRARRGTALAEAIAGADLVVTSYTLFRLEIDAYVATTWGGLVLDEAQNVKNHQGKTYQCVRRLDVPFRLALTGTPLENRLMELWSLLSIVAPGLYPYPKRFTEAVANPVEKEGDRAVLDRFRRRIGPFLLRRTKELVAADLPPKQEQVLEVTLTPRHRRAYDLQLQHERQQVLGLLGDFDRQRVAIFRSLTRLRQMSLDAALVDSKYDGIGSAKIDALADHLLEVVAEGHRALVFSQFTRFLSRVRDRLEAEGITAQYLDGRTRRRSDVIGQFKAGVGEVFLISLKAGGVGLTLTEADYVFVLDPWWNPAVEAQAVDRAHRIGQDRPVIVYRLVAADTIEQKVMELKARKAELFDDVLGGAGAGSTAIDAEDIRALFD